MVLLFSTARLAVDDVVELVPLDVRNLAWRHVCWCWSRGWWYQQIIQYPVRAVRSRSLQLFKNKLIGNDEIAHFKLPREKRVSPVAQDQTPVLIARDSRRFAAMHPCLLLEQDRCCLTALPLTAGQSCSAYCRVGGL